MVAGLATDPVRSESRRGGWPPFAVFTHLSRQVQPIVVAMFGLGRFCVGASFLFCQSKGDSMDLTAISNYFDRRLAIDFLPNTGLMALCRPVPVPLNRV